MLIAPRRLKGLSGSRGDADEGMRRRAEAADAFFAMRLGRGAFIFILSNFYKRKERKQMKTMSKILTLVMLLSLLVTLAACGNKSPEQLWDENAIYLEDKTFGEGGKTVKLEVKAGERSVTFTVLSDEQYLGNALLEHGLIAGEAGAYGLYVKTVNGVLADYDADQSYWAFYKDGSYAEKGVDMTEFADGEHYEFVYTR